MRLLQQGLRLRRPLVFPHPLGPHGALVRVRTMSETLCHQVRSLAAQQRRPRVPREAPEVVPVRALSVLDALCEQPHGARAQGPQDSRVHGRPDGKKGTRHVWS